MANILFKNADKTVNTIAERNAISPKLDDMEVVVLDAIADIEAGPGAAVYKWSESLNVWIMLANSKDEPLTSLSFSNDTLTYVDENGSSTNIDLSIYANLDGDTFTGDVSISKAAGRFIFDELDYANGNSGIEWTTPVGQDIELIHEIIDSNIQTAGGNGQALKVRQSGSSAAVAGLEVEGEIFADTNKRVFHDGYHPNADKLTSSRNISLTGDVTGSASFDGSSNISIDAVVQDDSHNHESLKNLFTTRTSSQSNHYGASVVLLAPAYDGVEKASDKLDGNITLYRGNSTALNTCVSIDISYHSAYIDDILTYHYNVSEGRNTEFVYCTYNGVKYLALNIKANSQNNIIYWNGIRSGDLSEFFTVVDYIGDGTQGGALTIVNQEVHDSIEVALPTSSIFGSGDGTWSIDYDGYKGHLSDIDISGTVLLGDKRKINQSVELLENQSTQYIILCKNEANNDVNGHLAWQRTSGNFQGQQIDVIVSSRSSGIVGGSLKSFSFEQQSEEFKLVTFTSVSDSESYVAIKYYGNDYPANLFSYFDGYINTTAGSRELTVVDATDISNEADLNTRTKFEINGNSVFHEGNQPDYTQVTGLVSELDNRIEKTVEDLTEAQVEALFSEQKIAIKRTVSTIPGIPGTRSLIHLPNGLGGWQLAARSIGSEIHVRAANADGSEIGPWERIFTTGYTPSISQISGLQSELDDKLDSLSGTKGDIYVHNGTNFVKLSAGVDGQILVSDSSTATGLKWDYPTIG
ncbi:long tail fiber protein distal subunit [Vibrio phage VB_VaC_TDDLMA]